MSPPNAISVNNICKAYRIGAKVDTPDTLVGALKAIVHYPVKNFRYLRSLSRVGHRDSNSVVWALRDISFDVPQGEVVGIVGRNGAGKSTLLKVLSRITDPTSGAATIRGRVSSLLEVGTGFHPELSGRDNIYMNGTILGMTKREIDRKFDEIVDFSGVDRFLDTPIKRYSSGMQVRLAFSVAAHLDPEILVIDEVLAVGDAEFQKRCIGKMQEVASSGRTVLFVSHNMTAIGQLCTSGILLSQGRVAATGSLEHVVQSYMDDLFQTRAEVGNDTARIRVGTAVDGDELERIWHHGSTLTVNVMISTQDVIQAPAIDLYFHASSGRVIFAQSDRFIDSSSNTDAHSWQFEFQFKNNGFVSDYMTLDVGFRFSSSTRYLGLWRSLAAVALGAVPPGYTHGRDCPIAVPCQVQLREMAA